MLLLKFFLNIQKKKKSYNIFIQLSTKLFKKKLKKNKILIIKTQFHKMKHKIYKKRIKKIMMKSQIWKK